jgi:hypothetical protein
VPNPTDTARALVEKLEFSVRDLCYEEDRRTQRPANLKACKTEVDDARAALLTHVAGVDTSEQRCKTCRFAVTDSDGEMECERMSRVQHVGSLSNGTACATPYEGCSAVLEVTPDFGCVRWEARKDGV